MAEPKETDNDSPLPSPFAPPDDEFCSTNVMGDDIYFSLFQPCEFVFYKGDPSKIEVDHFSCANMKPFRIIGRERRKVMMWPDSCVAIEPRCYSLNDYPDLANYTSFPWDEQYRMEFPPKAHFLSVNCTGDFALEQEFMDHLPEELHEFSKAITTASIILVCSVFMLMVSCCVCCCGSCFRFLGRGSGSYPRRGTAAVTSDARVNLFPTSNKKSKTKYSVVPKDPDTTAAEEREPINFSYADDAPTSAYKDKVEDADKGDQV